MVTADIEFCADNGLDARFVGFSDKLEGAHHVAVIGNGHGRHPLVNSLLDQLWDGAHGLKNAELAVRVQVNKRHIL